MESYQGITIQGSKNIICQCIRERKKINIKYNKTSGTIIVTEIIIVKETKIEYEYKHQVVAGGKSVVGIFMLSNIAPLLVLRETYFTI